MMSLDRMRTGTEERESLAQMRKERIALQSGAVDLLEMVPAHEEDSVPLVVVPGCQTSVEMYAGAVRELATEHGRRTLALSEVLDAAHAAKSTHTERATRNAAGILEMLARRGIERADVLAHSAGAIDAIVAAAEHPEKFRSIVMYAPAGFKDGDDTVQRQLFGGWMSALTREPPRTVDELQRTILNAFDVYAYVAMHPLEAMKEQADIATEAIEADTLKHVREHGVRVAIICPVDDQMYDPAETASHVSSELIDGFLTVRGAHSDIERDPAHIALAANLLKALREKDSRAREAMAIPEAAE